jgi:hypothetical protein
MRITMKLMALALLTLVATGSGIAHACGGMGMSALGGVGGALLMLIVLPLLGIVIGIPLLVVGVSDKSRALVWAGLLFLVAPIVAGSLALSGVF